MMGELIWLMGPSSQKELGGGAPPARVVLPPVTGGATMPIHHARYEAVLKPYGKAYWQAGVLFTARKGMSMMAEHFKGTSSGLCATPIGMED